MALPENLGSIKTNLSFDRLVQVAQAIENGQADQVPGSASLYNEIARCRFRYLGIEYDYVEEYELCVGINEVPPG